MFADRLQSSIAKSHSHLVAGCDPIIDTFPAFLIEEAEKQSLTDDDFIERVLSSFCELLLSAVDGQVAAVKPNIAFFEQYGIPGVKAFSRFCQVASTMGLLVIADAKRGDIGSTAEAYSAAFLANRSVKGRKVRGFQADALTVNPYLGFDTLEPFLRDCKEYEKGIFVLVQTSNPGAAAMQGLVADGVGVREHVARWLANRAQDLLGACGWSGVGAVVGASYPDEARMLRALMPTNMFLIPGLGAQGAGAQDSVAGFGELAGVRGGGIINVSRGLVAGVANTSDELVSLISSNVERFNCQIRDALI